MPVPVQCQRCQRETAEGSMHSADTRQTHRGTGSPLCGTAMWTRVTVAAARTSQNLQSRTTDFSASRPFLKARRKATSASTILTMTQTAPARSRGVRSAE